jgi:hypothetical protein
VSKAPGKRRQDSFIHKEAFKWLTGITPTLYYLFFAVMEVACTLLIVWYALRWKPSAQ